MKLFGKSSRGASLNAWLYRSGSVSYSSLSMTQPCSLRNRTNPEVGPYSLVGKFVCQAAKGS